MIWISPTNRKHHKHYHQRSQNHCCPMYSGWRLKDIGLNVSFVNMVQVMRTARRVVGDVEWHPCWTQVIRNMECSMVAEEGTANVHSGKIAAPGGQGSGNFLFRTIFGTFWPILLFQSLWFLALVWQEGFVPLFYHLQRACWMSGFGSEKNWFYHDENVEVEL